MACQCGVEEQTWPVYKGDDLDTLCTQNSLRYDPVLGKVWAPPVEGSVDAGSFGAGTFSISNMADPGTSPVFPGGSVSTTTYTNNGTRDLWVTPYGVCHVRGRLPIYTEFSVGMQMQVTWSAAGTLYYEYYDAVGYWLSTNASVFSAGQVLTIANESWIRFGGTHYGIGDSYVLTPGQTVQVTMKPAWYRASGTYPGADPVYTIIWENRGAGIMTGRRGIQTVGT